MVSAWGMSPATAGDGNEALLKLNEFPADVIITDLIMPRLDGFGSLQRLREPGRYAADHRAHRFLATSKPQSRRSTSSVLTGFSKNRSSPAP